MEYFISLDVGTTSVKAAIYSETLQLVSLYIDEYTLLTPKKDYVEMPPIVYLESVKKAIKKALEMSKIDPASVVCITATTQGETLIPIDKAGSHLHNAVVWLDSRAKEQSEKISKKFTNLEFYKKTGLPEINGFCPVAKLLWFKEQEPAIYEATYKFLMLEDYLIFMLCGKAVSNPALLCSGGYFDIFTEDYYTEMLDYIGVDKKKLPEILPCATIVGNIHKELAVELGLSENVKITTGAMDQVASAVGSRNIKVGNVTDTTGTCQVVAATCEKLEILEHSSVSIYAHAIKNKHLKIVISQTAGIAYKWFRYEFCKDLNDKNAFKQMDELAFAEPAGSKGLIMYPHMTGMQFPYSNEAARGVFFGVGLDTSRGCFIRSIMEGVGYMLKESITAMNIEPENILSLGGGSKSPLWCQIKADICSINIATMKNEETATLGAAMLGGLAIGKYSSLEQASECIEISKTYNQNAEHNAIYSVGYEKYLSMHTAFLHLFNNSL